MRRLRLRRRAARAGAAEVVALEKVAPIAELSERIVRDNGCDDKIRVVPALSTEVTAEQLGGRFDLIVSEIFGDEPLSEGVLPTLAHAAEHLLAPGGIFLPARCSIVAALAHCRALDATFCASHCAGFDVSSINQFCDGRNTRAADTIPGFELCTDPVVLHTLSLA